MGSLRSSLANGQVCNASARGFSLYGVRPSFSAEMATAAEDAPTGMLHAAVKLKVVQYAESSTNRGALHLREKLVSFPDPSLAPRESKGGFGNVTGESVRQKK